MSKTAIVFSCAHSDPSTPNDRFDWLGEFIYDVNPNYIVDLGDGADMKSLNSFDTRYPEAIVSQNYEQDIEHYNEAMERLRKKPSIRKYKKPFWIGFEGNHENRIKKRASQKVNARTRERERENERFAIRSCINCNDQKTLGRCISQKCHVLARPRSIMPSISIFTRLEAVISSKAKPKALRSK